MATPTPTADVMSEDLAAAILPVTVLIGVLSVAGLFGNGTVLYVYKFKYPPSNFRTFVLFLALIDFTSCLLILPLEMVVQRMWFNFPSSLVWLCVLKKIINGCVICMSACILLLISVDRFRKVCRPLSWQITPARAIQLCAAIVLVFVILYLPGIAVHVFGRQTTNVTYQGRDIIISTCQRADATKNDLWIGIYIPIVFYVPTILATVSNSLLYVLVVKRLLCGNKFTLTRRSKRDDRESSVSRMETPTDSSQIEDESVNDEPPSSQNVSSSNKLGTSGTTRDRGNTIIESRIKTKTLILLIVTSVFDVTMLVYFALYSVIIQKAHIFELVSEKSAGALFFFWRLYFFNHVINPVVYGFCDTRFRDCLKDLTRRRPCSSH